MPYSGRSIALLRVLRLLPLLMLMLGLAPAPAGAQALYERFIRSVTIDRSDDVAALLARGMDPNTVDPNGDPVLVIAARSGFEPTLDALLAARAKVNIRNPFGDSAIMVAAIGGRLAIVKKLYARGAEINHPGWTPLIYAATGGHADVAPLSDRCRRQRQCGIAERNDGADDGGARRACAVVDLLLERGRTSDIATRTVRRRWAWAKRGGFDAIERALRRRGAEGLKGPLCRALTMRSRRRGTHRRRICRRGLRRADQLGHKRDQPARAVVALLPIALRHGDDLDLPAAMRSVDEAIVAKVNANMRKRRASGVEEHQVAGLEIARGDPAAQPCHFPRRARQGHADDLLEYIADQAAAIETMLGAAAAVTVVDADQTQRVDREVLGALQHASPRMVYGAGVTGGGGGLRRQSGARQQHQRHRGQRDDRSVAQRGRRCAGLRHGIGV
jgi:hypothetical protein